MKRFWREDGYRYYRKAADLLNYPAVPFGALIDHLLRPDDRVVDLGAGFGVVSRYVAPKVREVLAVDQDSLALEHLIEDARAEKLDNVLTETAIWPNIEQKPWDVALSFYHPGFLDSPEKRSTLWNLTRREGLMNSAVGDRESFHAPLARALGLPSYESTPTTEEPTAVEHLEELGFKTNSSSLVHDFSQPVQDLDDGVRYMMGQLRLDDSYRARVRELAPQFLEERKGQLLLPIHRSIRLIHFWK